VKKRSIFPDGNYKFSGEPWPQLQSRNDRIEITRDPKTAHKMGSDGRFLAWIGTNEICVISPQWYPDNIEHPDRGANAEVYTNPDPKKYVELETLGPLSLMQPGIGWPTSSTTPCTRGRGKVWRRI